jgi:hypothetical protein
MIGEGRMTWRYRIDIKSIMQRYDNKEINFQECLKEVGDKLNACQGLVGTDFAQRLARCDNEDQANLILSSLYDFCDQRRIWLGL